MKVSRRDFIGKSVAGVAAIGAVSALGAEKVACSSTAPMVAACGISCSACPLLKAEKCKGCGAGNAVTAEVVTMKNCPVLTCASKKKIAYCGTDCKMYTKCAKLIGRPYAKDYMEMIAKRLG